MARTDVRRGWPEQRLVLRIREFLSELPRAIGGDEEAVHDVRVAGRRLRVGLAVLPVRPHGGRAGRARRMLKRLISAAGEGRDADVCLALLQQIAPARSTPEAAVLRRRLKGARARSRRRMADALLDQPIARMRQSLRELLAQHADEPAAVTERLRRQVGERGGALLGALAALGAHFDADELHSIRGEVRTLRYLSELVVTWREAGEDVPVQLRELQDDLGRLHDEWLLAQWLAAQAETADRRGAAALGAEARRLQGECLELCRVRHREFLSRDPARIVQSALALAGVEESSWRF